MSTDMPGSSDQRETDLTERFRAELNKHGYPFQFAAARAARRAFEGYLFTPRWQFEAAEFPVNVQGHDTRIDLVLKRQDQQTYLAIECKRADPAVSDWCFASFFPYIHRRRVSEAFLAEQFRRNGFVTGAVRLGNVFGKYYNIGLEVKDPRQRGDGTSGGRGAIEAAAGQACRGLNGMVECFAARPVDDFQAVIIPVIFTTARLWGCEVNLASATDLETGKIGAEEMEGVEPLEVVFYQYHQSPGLKHGLPITGKPVTLGEILDFSYIRTIPVVTAAGIEKFLTSFDPEMIVDA